MAWGGLHEHVRARQNRDACYGSKVPMGLHVHYTMFACMAADQSAKPIFIIILFATRATGCTAVFMIMFMLIR